VAKPNHIELPSGDRIPILYEDRSVLAIDKPAGWMLAPDDWHKTSRNLHNVLMGGLQRGDFWARCRQLRFLRYVHRLDAETSGVLLLAKSPGALKALSALFESRKMEKVYLAAVRGVPRQKEWACNLKLAPVPGRAGKMQPDQTGKEAETRFRALDTTPGTSLLEVRPLTGRTHQIRVHLAACGHPVVGDSLYGPAGQADSVLGLRATRLSYTDPFTHRPVCIQAPSAEFLQLLGFRREEPAMKLKVKE
jgi:23S rRNA pseudouridine1911/1915/1917 synthase